MSRLAFIVWGCLALGALRGCQLSLEHATCPCADGWTCCETNQVCVADQAVCPGGDEQPLEPPVQRLSLDRPWQSDNFGRAVALAGDRAAVGVPGGDQAALNGGAVVVLERRGGGDGVWVRTAVLTAPDARSSDELGTAVAFVSEDALVVGAPRAGADLLGRVYVFRRGAGGWAWQQTIAPDPPSSGEDERGTYAFGTSIAADAGRFVVGASDSIAQLYELTPAGAAHVARLTAYPSPLGATFPVCVALHGATAVLYEQYNRAVYVFDEASGWTATRVADLRDAVFLPRAIAVDGQRIAIPGRPGVVRIIERTATGWAAPTEVVLPAVPNTWMPIALAWRGSDLIMTTRLYGDDVLGMARVRSVAGAWRPDPIVGQALAAPEWMSLSVDGDRAIVGIPYAPPASAGNAKVLRIDDAGYVEEATITIDDRARIDSIVGDRTHLLIEGLGERIAWFTRTGADGYRERPALVLRSHARLGWRASVSGSHALMTIHNDTGAPIGVQAFELGDRDWVAGSTLTAPQDGIAYFPSQSLAPLAVDGDTAVIGADVAGSFRGLGFVYTWSSTGWQRTATLPGPGCSPQVAIAGARIALWCTGYPIRVFERAGDAWLEQPAPKLPVPTIYRVLLSGDRMAIATTTAGHEQAVTEVFRWVEGAWRSELHVAQVPSNGVIALAALAGDRLVLHRTRTSVTPYRFVAGAWVEQPALELPDRPRSPDAAIRDVVLTDDQVVVSVPADTGEGAQPQGAIYAISF